MAISLEGEDYQNKTLYLDGVLSSVIGCGDFEIHTANSLKEFSKKLPDMIYPTLIDKLYQSQKKYVKIEFIYNDEKRSFFSEFIDFKLKYLNTI